jgi:site-specific DNA recombinase
MTKQAAVYARVSTDEQAAKGYSLPTQLAACREYAQRQGWTVAAEYADDCSGTIPVRERPEGERLYQDVAEGKVNAVVLYTIDRAARDEDVIEFLIFKRDMNTTGVELHFCDSGKTANDPIAGIVDYFKAAQASEERKKIRERSMRGRRAKAESGKWVGIKTPYGYEKVGAKRDARLVINSEQAAIVRRIFAMYTGPEFVSMHSIANTLTAEEVPTPRRALMWGQTTVRALLVHRLFIGEIEYAGIMTVIPELAIIDRATFAAAQERIKKNKAQARRNRKNDYLLSGFVRCSCERAMYGASHPSADYYRCCGNRHGHQTRCYESKVRIDKIDPLVWGAVTRGLSREVLIEGLTAQNKRKAAELNPKWERLTLMNDSIAKLDRKIKRYLNDFGEMENDKLAADAKELAQVAADQRETLVEKRDRLELELKERNYTEVQQAAILARAEALHRKVTTGRPTLAQKREFLRTLDLQVTIEAGRREMNVSWMLGNVTLPIEYTSC